MIRGQMNSGGQVPELCWPFSLGAEWCELFAVQASGGQESKCTDEDKEWTDDTTRMPAPVEQKIAESQASKTPPAACNSHSTSIFARRMPRTLFKGVLHKL